MVPTKVHTTYPLEGKSGAISRSNFGCPVAFIKGCCSPEARGLISQPCGGLSRRQPCHKPFSFLVSLRFSFPVVPHSFHSATSFFSQTSCLDVLIEIVTFKL